MTPRENEDRKSGESLDLSILVVSYNTFAHTRACLESIFRTTKKIHFEVIVVDNASTDGSAQMIATEFPQVCLISCDVNFGFGAANNLARQCARAERFLLLNPDTVVLEGAVDGLLAFSQSNPCAGIVGGRTLSADGVLDPKSGRGSPTPWSMICRALGLSRIFARSRVFDPESLGAWRDGEIREVEVVSGCFFMVDRALWDQLGGFDPSFFMYGEETDFCIRARNLGYRPLLSPEIEIIHFGGASEPIRADKMVKLFAAHSTLFRKHWSRPAAAFGVATLWFWAASRSLCSSLLQRLRFCDSKKRAYEWTEIWRRRSEWLGGFPPRIQQPKMPRIAPDGAFVCWN